VGRAGSDQTSRIARMHGFMTFSDKWATSLLDSHLIAATRLILAISAVLILDNTSMPQIKGDATRLVLMFYIAYSAAFYLLTARRLKKKKTIPTWSHWADISWYSLLLALSGGSQSIFFFGFFFAILVASFEWGFTSGLITTVVASLLFITIGLITREQGSGFDLQRFLVRLLYLYVLGYLMAHWGGLKVTLNRRLKLLKEIASLTTERMAVDALIDSTIERLRAFYNVDIYLLILADSGTPEYRLHRVKHYESTLPADTEPIPVEMVRVLLALPAEHAVVSSEGLLGWRRLDYTYDVTTHEIVTNPGDERATLASLLDAESLVTVPLRYHNQMVGRLYLTAQRRRAFGTFDVEFLIQVADYLMPVIDSIRLVDRLAMEAAEEERKRIARDIHDSIIQPYIGLQMGLAGIRQKLAADYLDASNDRNNLLAIITDAAADTDRLIEMTGDGISDLRQYVRGLRDAGDSEGGLISSVRRFASKFTEATNIVVQVRADPDIGVDERLTSEIFQIIVEGLSNIRRHTQSARAFVDMECSNGSLIVRIENDGTRGSTPTPFKPQSIAERALSLGGRAYVEFFGDMGTSVIVEVPLHEK
jgi:signal transduction histidine kinase